MSGWVNGSKTPIYKGNFEKVEISLLIPSPSSNYKIFLACNHVLYHYCCVHFLLISVVSLMSIFFPMEDVHKADKKHPVQKTPFMASCTLLHDVYVTAFSGKHSVRERENANMKLFLVREKHFWKNQKNAFGKKEGKINTVTISNCDYCNYISLKEKERRVKHFIVYVTYFQISRDFSSPLFNNRGTARRHSSLSYTALL